MTARPNIKMRVTKSILMSDETHAELDKMGKRHESFSDIIDRLLNNEVK